MAKKVPQIVKDIKKYQNIEIDYKKHKTISFSQFQIFSQCPHKWALQYRDGHYKSESSIYMTFGTALHSMFQEYLTVMYEQSVAEADRRFKAEDFENTLIQQYKADYEKNNKTHFSNPNELREFYNDGLNIINWFFKNKGKYFSKRNNYLVGIELPIIIQPNDQFKNIIYKGFLDVVIYDEANNKIKIIDIKTSTRGWKDKEKKDEIKNMQLILYKKFFSEQFNFPVEDIDIEYFIVKRKIKEDSEFPDKRIQIHRPASGKIKIGQANQKINSFIELAFSKTGTYNTNEQPANPSKWNCTYCVFKNNKDLCQYSYSDPIIEKTKS